MTTQPLFTLPLDEILRRTSQRTAYPGGGAASAAACASAAALVAMAARFAGSSSSGVWGEAEAAIAELAELADADADLFGELLRAWKLPRDHAEREVQISAAARNACQVPSRVCEIGARLAGHAACLVAEGKPDLKGDALTAVYLAHASVRGAARLVEINARQAGAPPLAQAARDLVAESEGVVERMEAALEL